MSSELKITSVEQAVVLYVLPEKLCVYEQSQVVNEIDLVHKEAVLLGVFFREQFKLVERKTLFDICWPGRVVSETSLNVAMMKLRKKLSEAGVELEIKTVPGQGYKLVSEYTLIFDAESEVVNLQSQKESDRLLGDESFHSEPSEELEQVEEPSIELDGSVTSSGIELNSSINTQRSFTSQVSTSTKDGSVSVSLLENQTNDTGLDEEKTSINTSTKKKTINSVIDKFNLLNAKRKVLVLYACTAIVFCYLYGGPFFW